MAARTMSMQRIYMVPSAPILLYFAAQLNMDSLRPWMVAAEGQSRGEGAIRRGRNAAKLSSKSAKANASAIDADWKYLSAGFGRRFRHARARIGLDEQRYAASAARSAHLSAESAGFLRPGNDAINCGS